MLSCVYHVTGKMRVVEDDEYKALLASGLWFSHPNEAKEIRNKHERQILEEPRLHDQRRKRGTNHKQPSTDGREPTQPNE